MFGNEMNEQACLEEWDETFYLWQSSVDRSSQQKERA